jgi:hypothetical protein
MVLELDVYATVRGAAAVAPSDVLNNE